MVVAGVPIYNFHRRNQRISQELGPGQPARPDIPVDWLLHLGQDAHDDDLKALCVGSRAARRGCLAHGHPSRGGVAFASLRATDDELFSLLRLHAPLLAFAEPDGFIFKFGEPVAPTSGPGNVSGNVSDQWAAASWGLDRIDARHGLSGSYNPRGTGAGVHVYVLDTGIEVGLADFGGRAVPAIESLGGSVVPCAPDDGSCAHDGDGHGTFCAGVIGGRKYGVAKEARIHAVKVLDDTGNGRFSWLVAAMDWLAAHGERPAVLSMSFGAEGASPSLERAVSELAASSRVPIVAAGNSGSNACSFTPARTPAAITVGATERDDTRAWYSNHGPCLDIFAPGSDIASDGLQGQASVLSGTSMACPFVAGAAALLLQSGTPPQAVASALAANATSGVVVDAGLDSPNLLLFVGKAASLAASAGVPLTAGKGTGGGGTLLLP